MQAMLCRKSGLPLEPADIPRPEPAADQVLVKVLACGVCRTDLHIVDGELPHPGFLSYRATRWSAKSSRLAAR